MSVLSVKILNVQPPTISNEIQESKAWLENIKKAYQTASKEKRLFLLTTLPRQYWPNSRIESEFGASSHLVSEAMKLLETSGPFSWPEKKPPREYSSEIISNVKSFFKSDKISGIMPGMKDKISVK